MSDARLRALERRWRGTGGNEAGAAYLRERVRSGDLSQEQLLLAGSLGHEASREAATGLWPRRAVSWTEILAPCGQEAFARAAIALSRPALRTWRLRFPGDDRPERALAISIAGLRDPNETNLAALRESLEGLNALFFDCVGGGEEGPAVAGRDEHQAALSALQCVQIAGQFALGSIPEPLRIPTGERLLESAGMALGLSLASNPQRGPSGTIGAGLPAALFALAEDLIPWALGWGDPLEVEAAR